MYILKIALFGATALSWNLPSFASESGKSTLEDLSKVSGNLKPSCPTCISDKNSAPKVEVKKAAARGSDLEKLCSEPFRQICRKVNTPSKMMNSSILDDALNKVPGKIDKVTFLSDLARDINKKTAEYLDPKTRSASHEALETLLNRYADFARIVEDEVYAKLRKKGHTREAVLAHIQQVQKHLSTNLKGSNVLGSGPRAEEAATFPVITAVGLKDATFKAKHNFFLACNSDALANQAFKTQEGFVVCPGKLIGLLTEPIDSLNAIVAHELGHFIAWDQNRKGDETAFQSNYGGYLQCINDQTKGKLRSIDDTIKFLENKGIPALQDMMAAQKEKGISSEYQSNLYALQQSISSGTAKLVIMKRQQAKLAAVDPVWRTPAYTHAEELISDRIATKAVVAFLKNTPDDQLSDRVVDQFSPLCTDENMVLRTLYGDGVDDGSHPPSRVRIENVFADPELRGVLGCGPIPPGTIACDFGTTTAKGTPES